MQRDPDSIVVFAIPIPFAGRGAVCEAAWSRAADVDVGEASKSEAEHGTREDDNCLCVLVTSGTESWKGKHTKSKIITLLKTNCMGGLLQYHFRPQFDRNFSGLC